MLKDFFCGMFFGNIFNHFTKNTNMLFINNFINFFSKKKFFLIAIFILLIDYAHADIGRKTSFDNRGQCEQNKGVWREFGNGCVDECFAKFDEFGVCTYARTFGCDCGKGKCWNGEECVGVIAYKKIFDDLKLREFEEMSQAKKKRIAEAKKYQQDLIKRMIENRSALTVAKFNTDDVVVPHNNFSNNNYSDVYNKKFPQIAQGKQYVTNFDERYGGNGNPDPNRIKSIQYQAPKNEIIEEPSQNINTNLTTNQVKNQPNQSPILNNPNQNQQLVIQQPGMENQVIANPNPEAVANPNPAMVANPNPAVIANPNDPASQNNNISQTKLENTTQKPAEVFEVPVDFTKNNDKNKKSSELQLPIIELPR